MRSFKIGISDGGDLGIEQDFCIFASDIVEAAIKAFDFINTIQEAIRSLAAEGDENFKRLDPENVRVNFISDEGELTGGSVQPTENWAEDFADKMVLRIKKFLGSSPC